MNPEPLNKLATEENLGAEGLQAHRKENKPPMDSIFSVVEESGENICALSIMICETAVVKARWSEQRRMF
jgi:hypothetical protein